MLRIFNMIMIYKNKIILRSELDKHKAAYKAMKAEKKPPKDKDDSPNQNQAWLPEANKGTANPSQPAKNNPEDQNKKGSKKQNSSKSSNKRKKIKAENLNIFYSNADVLTNKINELETILTKDKIDVAGPFHIDGTNLFNKKSKRTD